MCRFDVEELDILESGMDSNFRRCTDTGDHAGGCHMRKEHTLAVFRIAHPIIHQVPVHTVSPAVTRMAAIAALPILETVGGIVEVTFAPVLDALLARRVE